MSKLLVLAVSLESAEEVLKVLVREFIAEENQLSGKIIDSISRKR